LSIKKHFPTGFGQIQRGPYGPEIGPYGSSSFTFLFLFHQLRIVNILLLQYYSRAAQNNWPTVVQLICVLVNRWLTVAQLICATRD